MMRELLILGRRWGLLVLIAAANWLVSSLAITPWSEAVRSSSLSAFPDPDAALLSEGGLLFVEWLRVDGVSLLGALRASLMLMGVSALVGVLPAALLMLGLAETGKLRLVEHGPRVLTLVPAFLLLFGGTLLCQALLVLLWVVLWGVAANAAAPWAYPWLVLGLGFLVLVSWGLPSMLQDLTRAALVARERLPAALSRAVRSLWAHPLGVLAAYLVPAALGWLVAAASLALTAELATQKPAEFADSASFFMHQACMLVLVTLRAYWLVRALDLTSSSTSSSLPALADTRADSAEPAGPSPDLGA